jgi:AraC-like DNA-binding protein
MISSAPPARATRHSAKVPAAINPDWRVDLRFFNAPDEFEGCFTTIYRLNLTVPGGGVVVDHLQPGWGSLRFINASTSTFRIPGSQTVIETGFPAAGPSSLPMRFELGTSRMWGVGLFPLGWARFIGLPASEFANRAVDGTVHPAFSAFAALAHDLFRGAPDDAAEFALLMKVFRSLARPVSEEQTIRAVHAAIIDTEMASVAQLACRAGLTARQLERLCRRYFGFPPKLLLRRQRLMRTVAAYMVDQSSTWSSVIDGRYHDQAHFVREFQQFFLMTPSEYASLGHPVLTAFMAERKRILGAPTQFLDRQ